MKFCLNLKVIKGICVFRGKIAKNQVASIIKVVFSGIICEKGYNSAKYPISSLIIIIIQGKE